MRCSAGAALALVQHWAYNKRFVPVMGRLLEGASPAAHEGTAAPTTASLDNATTVVEKVKKIKQHKLEAQEEDAGHDEESLAEKKRKRKEKKAKKRKKKPPLKLKTKLRLRQPLARVAN